MREKIKQIIYQYSNKGGMCDDLEDGQILGIKTGVELEVIAEEIELMVKSIYEKIN